MAASLSVRRMPSPQMRGGSPLAEFWPPALRPQMEQFERMLDAFAGIAPQNREQAAAAMLMTPAIDISEDNNAYHVAIELPGVDESNIDVTMQGDTLVIRGEKQQQQEVRDRRHYVSERVYGSFVRTLALPEHVDRSQIDAQFQNGVLQLTLPKVQEVQHRKIEIRRRAQQAGQQAGQPTGQQSGPSVAEIMSQSDQDRQSQTGQPQAGQTGQPQAGQQAGQTGQPQPGQTGQQQAGQTLGEARPIQTPPIPDSALGQTGSESAGSELPQPRFQETPQIA